MTEYVNDITRPNTEVLMEETNKRMQTYYVYGNTRESSNSIWEDSRDCFANETGYYQYDGHGSVTSVTNDLGMVKDVFQYTPYGQVTLGSKAHESFYAYSGENFNPNTGLEYLRNRYYNTAMGRFQTEDTYLGNLNTPLTLNRYSYVMNNPINYIDPSGHMAAKQFTNAVLGSNAAAVVNPNLKKSAKKVDVGNSNSLTSRTVRTLKSSAAPSVPVPGNVSATTVSNARQAVNKVRARKDCGTVENSRSYLVLFPKEVQ